MISVVVNTDTRPGFLEKQSHQEVMLDGTRNIDYLIGGMWNKYNLFKASGRDVELIQFVDAHEGFDDWNSIIRACPPGMKLVVSAHHKKFGDQDYFPKFNDFNYMQALMMARGKYVVHFDGDMAAFAAVPADTICAWLDMLDSGSFDYISYPTPFSPNPDCDPKWDYQWVSTRFFLCKREVLDFSEIIRCLLSDEYLYGKYGEKYRRCPWMEHVLGIIAGPGRAFYLPMNYKEYMIFSWKQYVAGTFERLNTRPYSDVLAYVKQCGGISYPCDVVGVLP